MPGLQDWIHTLEEGKGTRYIKFGALLLVLIFLTVVYDLREYKCFNTQEAMDTAQLARNLASGEGYTTKFIRPLSLYLLQKKYGEEKGVLRDRHPDLANAPVYPVILAGLMKVIPFDYDITRRVVFYRYQPETMIMILNQVFFFIAAVLVYLLARRLFDPLVAALSTVVFIGTDLFWRFSASGLSTMLLVVLMLLITWCLVVIEQNGREGKKTPKWFIIMALLTGVLMGIATLTRYSFGWLMIPVIGYLALCSGQKRILICLLTAVAFAGVLAPWVFRNYRISGNLFGIAGYAIYQETDAFKGNGLERHIGKSFEAEKARTDLNHFLHKLMRNVEQIVHDDVPKLGGNWISAFFLTSLMLPFRNPALNRLRLFILTCLAVLIVVQALGKSYLSELVPEINSENLLPLLAPLLFIFGASLYFVLLDQLDLPFMQMRSVVTIAFTSLVCLPLVLTLLPPRSNPLAYPPYYPPGIQDVSRWMKSDELMMSDMPWAVAWYGDRQCVWLTLDAPFDPKQAAGSDFYKIYDYQKPIRALYLTMLTTDAQFFSQMLKDKDFAWGRFMIEAILKNNVPNGFPLKQAPPGFLRDGQLFLTDRPRWKTSS